MLTKKKRNTQNLKIHLIINQDSTSMKHPSNRILKKNLKKSPTVYRTTSSHSYRDNEEAR